MDCLSPSNSASKLCNSPRISIAKNIILGKQNITPKRLNFREEFINRLKEIRNDKIDKIRRICEDRYDVDYKSVMDLRKLLQPDKETSKLLEAKDVMDLLQQVENEVLEQEIEQQYYKDIEHETNTIIDNLMNHCRVCERSLNGNGDICNSCGEELNSAF